MIISLIVYNFIYFYFSRKESLIEINNEDFLELEIEKYAVINKEDINHNDLKYEYYEAIILEDELSALLPKLTEEINTFIYSELTSADIINYPSGTVGYYSSRHLNIVVVEEVKNLYKMHVFITTLE